MLAFATHYNMLILAFCGDVSLSRPSKDAIRGFRDMAAVQRQMAENSSGSAAGELTWL